MKKTNLDIADIQKLLQAGQLAEAKLACLTLLKKTPKSADIIHLLAMIYAEQENYLDAIECLQTATQIEPHNTSIQLNLANLLKAQGLYSQAAAILENLLELHPEYAPALNNLGSVYYAQGKLDLAIEYYQNATKQQTHYSDAYYNLGLALSKTNQISAAITAYETLLAFAPHHSAAMFQLACLIMRQEHYAQALKYFSILEEMHPHHFETQTNIATCYLKMGDFSNAARHYAKALELTPNDTQSLFNLGFINMQQGNIDTAIQHYQCVVQINPDDFAAHNNLGVAFLAKQHIGFALKHFQEALRLQPQNKAIQYTVNTLVKDQRLLAAPPEYVKSLFDAYADHYEIHLRTALEYRVPELLYQAVKKISAKTDYIMLDLGCGTGLCGKIFKPIAKNILGVDLSERMLAIASVKNVYDELVTDDLIEFLAKQQSRFDLVVSGDVFVYVGDLADIFFQVSRILSPAGLFVFNTEISTLDDYSMNQSGRFSHHKNYLDNLAKKNQFSIKLYETTITRMQNNAPVYGHLYVLTK